MDFVRSVRTECGEENVQRQCREGSGRAMKEVRLGYALILLSGPARAGKNRAGVCLQNWLNGDHFALSNALKRMTHEHYGLGTGIPPLHFEDMKDLPAPQFGGLTPRKAYIRFSEEIMKPRFGDGYLGLIGGRRVTGNRRRGKVTIVSGVGFFDEVLPLIEAAGCPQTLHIRVKLADRHIRGRSDSRRPLDLSSMGVDSIELVNRDCGQLISDVVRSIDELRPK